MNDSWTAARRISMIGLGFLMLLLPACQSAGPWAGGQADAPSRIAYKPAPTSLRGRAFYVSGYGGADYSPNRPRRVRQVEGEAAYAVPAPPENAPAVTIRQGTWDEP